MTEEELQKLVDQAVPIAGTLPGYPESSPGQLHVITGVEAEVESALVQLAIVKSRTQLVYVIADKWHLNHFSKDAARYPHDASKIIYAHETRDGILISLGSAPALAWSVIKDKPSVLILLFQQGNTKNLPLVLKELPEIEVHQGICSSGPLAHQKKAFISRPPAVISTTREFAAKQFPPVEQLLVVKDSGSLVLSHPASGEIHAFRGVGKTNFTLGLLDAVARGGDWLCYTAPKARTVLYIDGEMDGSDLQESLNTLAEENENFKVLAVAAQPDYFLPSIVLPDALAWYEEQIETAKAEVVVFDNFSALANIGTNDEDSWLVWVQWQRKMRNLGITVIYLGHDGKGKMQRGHSKAEDFLTWVIHLTWQNGYKGSEGLRLRMEFEKARKPVKEMSRLDIELSNNEWAWAVAKDDTTKMGRPITEENEQKKILVLEDKKVNPKMSERALAAKHGVSKTQVHNWLAEYQAQNEIEF